MSIMIIAILGIIVVAAFMIVPRLSAGGAFSQTSSSQTEMSNKNKVVQTNTNGVSRTDVSGNGCACSNGVCEGNCSEMEQIDLQNFSPLDWVEQQT